MAEDTDNTQKQKAPLIKHANTGQAGTKGPAEQGERRKVIVLKKKPGMAAGTPAPTTPAAQPPAMPSVKKLQTKVVVSPGRLFAVFDGSGEIPHFRISFANVPESRIAEGIGIIASEFKVRSR